MPLRFRRYFALITLFDTIVTLHTTRKPFREFPAKKILCYTQRNYVSAHKSCYCVAESWLCNTRVGNLFTITGRMNCASLAGSKIN